MSSSNSNRRKRRRRSNNSETEFESLENSIKKLKLIDLKEYKCCVCSELPTDETYQCSNGCIICSSCYPKLHPCQCPLCRVPMDRNKPIRCRMAEKTLSLRIVTCRHKKCGKSMLFDKVKDHEANECAFKPMECKYKLLGCSWKGIRRDLKKHESKCAASINANKSLEIVQDLTRKLMVYKNQNLNLKLQKFCKNAHMVSTGLICEHGTERAPEEGFNAITSGNIFFIDFVVWMKAERKRGNGNHAMYEISVKIQKEEDFGGRWNGDIYIGVMVHAIDGGEASCELMEEFSHHPRRSEADTGWMPFQRLLKRNEYIDTFRNGVRVKVFDFSQ